MKARPPAAPEAFTRQSCGPGKKFSTTIYSTCTQSDGKILIGGSFAHYKARNRNYLVRLLSNGSVDTSFCANAVDSGKLSNTVFAIAVQGDGKIILGGSFANYGNVSARNRVLRLNSDGTLDTSFCTNAVDGNKFNGTVYAITVQSDGKILVGGNFTSYGGTSGRSYLIRLNSDGTLDTTFCTNAVDGNKFNSIVYTIAVQPSDGKILIGGNFTNYGGTSGRNYLVRTSSTGVVDNSFCSIAVDSNWFNSTVRAIVVQSDGKILIGGGFSNYGLSSGRNSFIRLLSSGYEDTSFCSKASDGNKFNLLPVYYISVQSDGNILVGGNFTSYGGTSGRSYLIRLNSDGTLDTTFCSNAVDGGKFNSSVWSVIIHSDGILVGGNFYLYGYLSYLSSGPRNYLVRLNSNGAPDSDFMSIAVDSGYLDTTSVPSVNCSAVQSDGKILIGGYFNFYQNLSGRNYLLRFSSSGVLDGSFTALAVDGKLNAVVKAMAIQSDGKILVGGAFSDYGGTSGRSCLIRLNSDGTLDTTFCSNAVDSSKFSSFVNAITVQSDGKILVGGAFTNYGGTSGRSYLIRLNSDGTLDTTFCSNAVDSSKFNGNVAVFSVQSDGKILVGGSFFSYGGTLGRKFLIRLNSDGTLDTTFCSNAVDSSKFGNSVNAITVQSDGKILVGGVFTSYGGTSGRSYLIRLNSDGTLDTTFCTNAVDSSKFNSTIFSLSVTPSGKIIIGGVFTNYASVSGRNYLVYLNSDGTFYSYPSTAITGTVNSLLFYSNKLLVGGANTLYGAWVLFDSNNNVI